MDKGEGNSTGEVEGPLFTDLNTPLVLAPSSQVTSNE